MGTVPTGLTNDAEQLTSPEAKIKLSGGTLGETYVPRSISAWQVQRKVTLWYEVPSFRRVMLESLINSSMTRRGVTSTANGPDHSLLSRRSLMAEQEPTKQPPERKLYRKVIDLTGRRFDRLVVVGFVGRRIVRQS